MQDDRAQMGLPISPKRNKHRRPNSGTRYDFELPLLPCRSNYYFTQVATYSSAIGYMGKFWLGSYWLILVATTNKTTFSSNPCDVTAWIERGNNLSIKLAVASTDLR